MKPFLRACCSFHFCGEEPRAHRYQRRPGRVGDRVGVRLWMPCLTRQWSKTLWNHMVFEVERYFLPTVASLLFGGAVKQELRTLSGNIFSRDIHKCKQDNIDWGPNRTQRTCTWVFARFEQKNRYTQRILWFFVGCFSSRGGNKACFFVLFLFKCSIFQFWAVRLGFLKLWFYVFSMLFESLVFSFLVLFDDYIFSPSCSNLIWIPIFLKMWSKTLWIHMVFEAATSLVSIFLPSATSHRGGGLSHGLPGVAAPRGVPYLVGEGARPPLPVPNKGLGGERERWTSGFWLRILFYVFLFFSLQFLIVRHFSNLFVFILFFRFCIFDFCWKCSNCWLLGVLWPSLGHHRLSHDFSKNSATFLDERR